MPRATVAEVSLDAIAHNFRTLMGLSRPTTQCVGIVKADAYGHGAVEIARTLSQLGVRLFAVALLDEAIALANAGGIEGRILVLGYADASEAEEIVARGFLCVASSLEQARALDRAAQRLGHPAGIHVKFDTGMGRIGFRPDEVLPALREIAARSGLQLLGAMTHFPSADEPDGVAYTRAQIATFLRLRTEIEAAGIRIPLWHAANSAGLLYFPESHLDAVRPGIALYGAYPDPDMPRPVTLRQALTLKTRIVRIRDLPAGSYISYGRTFRTDRPSRIATLPLGYADGYARAHSNRGEALVRGRRAPIAGRVCMDLMLVDVSDLPDAREGDEVVLYGRQGGETISVNALAQRLNTVPNEVMTSLGRRVPRVYVR